MKTEPAETAKTIPIPYLAAGATVVASALVAGDAALRAQWVAVAAALAIGVVWVVAQRRQARLGGFALAGLVLLSAAQMVFGGNHPLLIAATVIALCAYDLDALAARLRSFDIVGRDAIVRAHLLRLAAVAGTGLALGEAAVLLDLNLGFGWLVIVALFSVWVLSRVVRAIRKME
jgi:hypothetical protein